MIAAPCTPTTCLPRPRSIPEEVSSWTDYILQIGGLAAFMLAILVLLRVWYVVSNNQRVAVVAPTAPPQAAPALEPDPLTDPADIAWRAEQAAKAGLQVERTTVTGAKKITVAKFVPAPKGDQ